MVLNRVLTRVDISILVFSDSGFRRLLMCTGNGSFTFVTSLIHLGHFFVAVSVHLVAALRSDGLASTCLVVYGQVTLSTWIDQLSTVIMQISCLYRDASLALITVKRVLSATHLADPTLFAVILLLPNLVVVEIAL